MKPSEFANLVEQMRDAQKKYFKTRDQSDLKRSKNLEYQVDQFLQQRNQGKLL